MKAFNREKLKKSIKESVCQLYKAQIKKHDLYRNTVDCFSASIDCVVQGITLEEWKRDERQRQIQKTKQNAIGTLHEMIMSSIDGVSHYKVGSGELVDIECKEKKLIAEIKNKHNTTKGNHKVAVYDDLEERLANKPDYTGYYVEVLPPKRKVYDTPFTPSDNKTKTRRKTNPRIRQIDGKSFYALLTGHDDAIKELYENLPHIVSEIINEEFGQKLDAKKITSSNEFKEIFEKTYS
ncbi:Eco47II family restriction endonuclease [Vibrio cholerae]|uniref:Eco47II family restriction endonuclease n=1 Tax=Vibrio cholerae TaxID=666 RepID=UPI000E0C29C9|nr:Eco47II family restriction endonuclease [Vibrio cholerae]EIO5089494.1 Eco47II family restriction endonuclease [Vibrio cholerae]EKF9077603.1 Eco47II family restriction endonuclease [Vibrio cholerae]TYW44249.1 Eco47II family restriction endonuclease [Vibrio cholerae]